MGPEYNSRMKYPEHGVCSAIQVVCITFGTKLLVYCFTTQNSKHRRSFDAENSATSDCQLGFTRKEKESLEVVANKKHFLKSSGEAAHFLRGLDSV